MTTYTLDAMYELYQQGKASKEAVYLLLSDTRKEMLQHIQMVGKVKASDIAYVLYSSTQNASNELLALHRMGFLERELDGKAYVYWSNE